MVIYHGVALEDVIPARILDVKVSSIKTKVTARDRAVMDGAVFVSRRGESRTVTVLFTVLERDMTLRAEHAQKLRAWATADKPAPLTVPQRAHQRLMAVCTALPDVSGRDWWEQLSMTFTAYDPYFVDAAQKMVPCGLPFLVEGSGPPEIFLRAALEEAITAPDWSLDGAKTLGLTGSVGPGALEIDFGSQSITLNGDSIMDRYAFGSTFFDIGPGPHTVTGTGALYWRERWQ